MVVIFKIFNFFYQYKCVFFKGGIFDPTQIAEDDYRTGI